MNARLAQSMVANNDQQDLDALRSELGEDNVSAPHELIDQFKIE